MKEPRGYRNCNPLNIRRNSTKWQGLRKEQNDVSFFQFENMAWGYRAAFRTLFTYILKGFDTPEKIITRWAPPFENNTNAYILSVCRRTGLRPDEKLTRKDKYKLIDMVEAMAIVENGKNPDRTDIIAGWGMI